MTDMVIRSRGFNQGSDGAQITFVGILNDGEGLVLYRYEVPHAVAIKTGGGYSLLFSNYAAYSATSYRIVRKFIDEVSSGRPYDEWSIRRKGVGCVRQFPDDAYLGWTDKVPTGYGRKSQSEFEATLKPVAAMHPVYYGKLQELSSALQGALTRLD